MHGLGSFSRRPESSGAGVEDAAREVDEVQVDLNRMSSGMWRSMILEVFSCSGGMAEGFRRAGLPVGMAFDWNADVRASYEANLGHAPRCRSHP
jgi:hypothetical protein